MQITTLAPTARPGLLLKRQPLVAEPTTASAALAAEATPEQHYDRAWQRITRACQTERFADLTSAAREVLPHRGPGSNGHSLMSVLAEAAPVPIAAPGEERLWMLQRLDGELMAVLRMRDGGEVANAPHPNESRWWIRDGQFVLGTPQHQAATVFKLGATRPNGQRVMVGLFMDGKTVHVLTEVDCAYSRLRMIDRELIGAASGLLEFDQLRPVQMPPVPAVILAAQRTGSHLLLNLLNSSGRAFFDSELLDEKHILVFGEELRHEDAGLLYFMREHDPVRFIKTMLTRSHHVDGRLLGDMAVRGFKLFAKHSRVAWDWVLEEEQMRVIHLYRANLLAEYSSLLVAYAEGHWVGGPKELSTRQIHFDERRFLTFFETKQHYLGSVRERLAARPGPSMEIEYSDFSRQRINEVLSFLHESPQEAGDLNALGLKRQLGERVISRFTNPDDVRRCLEKLGKESWADVERRAVDVL
jgi:hypothetical protein